MFIVTLANTRKGEPQLNGTIFGERERERETAHGRSGHSHLTSSPFRGTIRATVGAIILVAIFLLGVGEAQAQTTAVCSNTPAAGERIKCEEYGDSTNNIGTYPF